MLSQSVGKNYYDVLGVSKTVSKEEIIRAYKAMVMTTHPDLFPGDESKESEFKGVIPVL